MCAAAAGPVSFENVNFHFSVVPLRVPLNKPCAAASFTTCFGTSCPDDRAAVHTVLRIAASEIAAKASVQTPAASSITSFLTVSSLRALPAATAVLQHEVLRSSRAIGFVKTATRPDL